MFQSPGSGAPEDQAGGQWHWPLISISFILFGTVVLEKFQTKMKFSKHTLFSLMFSVALGLSKQTVH